MKEQFKSYGDIDPLQGGIYVTQENPERWPTEYRIIKVEFYEDVKDGKPYRLTDSEVNYTDSWIDKKGVMSFIGMTEKSFDPVQYAIGCLDYHGADNFGDTYYPGDLIADFEVLDRLDSLGVKVS